MEHHHPQQHHQQQSGDDEHFIAGDDEQQRRHPFPSTSSCSSVAATSKPKSAGASGSSGFSPFLRLFSLCWTDRRVRVSLLAFLLPSCSIALIEPNATSAPISLAHHLALALLCLYAFPVSRQRWKFSTQAFCLGLASGWAIALALIAGTGRPHSLTFCLYAYVFCLFHFSEFLMTALTNPDSLRPDSFLLNHSPAYWTAAMCSWMEFWVRAWAFPSLCFPLLSPVGLLCCLVGELFRKLAMCHAALGFTHQIAVRRHRNHRLCTEGVYGLVRHPGYLGWLIWSVGTQLILCNVVCIQAYAYVAYRFFEDRIYEEERYLIEFFGQRYIAYQRRVPAGIPGIQGYSSTASAFN